MAGFLTKRTSRFAGKLEDQFMNFATISPPLQTSDTSVLKNTKRLRGRKDVIRMINGYIRATPQRKNAVEA